MTNNADPKMNPQKSMKQFSNVQSPPMNSNSNINSLPNLNPKIPPKTASSFKAEVWVKKWVDYSNKYGLGYLLSNGATGVFFNDSTKIVLDVKGRFIF